jgi:glycine cleavage system pyridoxal-binding protein P
VLREFAVRTPIGATAVVDRMAEEGYLAGIPLDGDDGVLVSVTERRTKEEIDGFVAAFDKVIR